MAHAQTANQTQSIGGKLVWPFRALGAFLVRLSEANVRVREALHLNALTDAELAQMDLAREDIARYVYRGSL
ncbi:MAG: DUF1127 domain-containing protein [Litoreibacter sp.]|nr:DUF1127 domain-containing protein [Litoreibacter sp.]